MWYGSKKERAVDPKAASFIEQAIENLVDEMVLANPDLSRREAHDMIRSAVQDSLSRPAAAGAEEPQHHQQPAGYEGELGARRARWEENYAAVGEAMKKSLPSLDYGGDDERLARECIAELGRVRTKIRIRLDELDPR